MSNGDCLSFFQRPIAAGLIAVAVILLALSALAFIRQRADGRTELAEAEAGQEEA